MPSGEPAIPRLRILIQGKTAAESYWQTPAPAADVQGQGRYVYPGQKGSLPLLLPKGPIEFRVLGRDPTPALVPVTDPSDPSWRFEWTGDAGKTWQAIEGALPIALHTL